MAELCLRVARRERLDRATLRRVHAAVAGEPWGPEHAAGALGKLRRDARAELTAGERWFLSHLLTTLYVGVYYHEKRPTRRLAHETALMYDALRGVLPVPYVEPLGWGTWASPPKPR